MRGGKGGREAVGRDGKAEGGSGRGERVGKGEGFTWIFVQAPSPRVPSYATEIIQNVIYCLVPPTLSLIEQGLTSHQTH